MQATKIRIHTEDPRLKRVIQHDPRSKRYRLNTSDLEIASVEWSLVIARLNQGDIGKCTAESACEVLGSAPIYSTLTADFSGTVLNDTWTSAFYSDEETLDGDGPYPPNDNGSSGLTSAKVAKARGLISGYTHTFTATDAIKGVQLSPACWGTLWKSGMDDVNTDTGQVKYSGAVRGGHELSVFKIVADLEQVWFHNHWGPWGYQNSGDGWISFADFEASLKDQGDMTFYTPLTQPAPTPQPAPSPTPTTATTITFASNAVTVLDSWAGNRHTGPNKAAAIEWKTGVRT